MIAFVRVNSTIVNRIKEEQQQDSQYETLKQKATTAEEENWKINDIRTLKYKGRLWVTKKLCKEVMKQAHESSYTMHPGTIMMY